MGSIPAFHAQASQEAAERTRAALGERDRASLFLDALDELLSAPEEVARASALRSFEGE